MHSTDTLIIGGGQAGLALSRCLTDRTADHLVLERGRVAERWRSERWNSLRLLTPNWMTRLPGHRYAGGDPDGFMTAPEVAEFFTDYARSSAAPVLEHTAVERLLHDGDAFVTDSDCGRFRSRNVVIATGWCDLAAIPREAAHLSARVHQVVPATYRSPDELPAGGVLVVGAAATGVQLADELHRSGRPVTLAVGSHTRLPRRYRGMDTFWWLDQIGAFDRTIDEVDDVRAARHEPSLQVAGRTGSQSLDLTTLQEMGVRLVGRVRRIDGERVTFDGGLGVVIAEADRRLQRLLARIDEHIERCGLVSELIEPEPLATADARDTTGSLHLAREGITSVVWATGHSRRYDWLELPILDRQGEIAQRRGITALPGAYVLGQRFQHFRNSNFIDGVGRDAEFLADHIRTRSTSVDARHTNNSRQD